MGYRFQVNLRGIIDLLSEHTYSSPEVYVRELLQNGVDAIIARRYLEPDFRGEINIEVPAQDEEDHSLLFRDDGIGLTEDEIHLFLATIGQTSKRGESVPQQNDFLGHFGVGLLACLVVSDEVVVTTRSSKDSSPTIEWRGRADGTYSLTMLDEDMEPGTEVRLRCKSGSEEYFAPEKVEKLARQYGSLLPCSINFTDFLGTRSINEEKPPWKTEHIDPEFERAAYLEYCETIFGMGFFDYIPLRSKIGDVQGVAFVLPFSPSLASRKTHRVYLKHMLLSEQTEGLLPDWAFFVKCVLNANDLRPTASRQSFYEDETLAATREELGRQLRHYLIDLAEKDPQRLRLLIQLHHLSIKALAVEDDDFFQIFIKWLPFETNVGTMTLTEYIKDREVVNFVTDLDEFRQIASIAAAQSLCVINAGYVYNYELIQKLAATFTHLQLRLVDGDHLRHSFELLTVSEQEEVAEFIELANQVLEPFKCSAEIRAFSPEELPALFNVSLDVQFKRTIEATKEVTDSFWSSLLNELGAGLVDDSLAQLCFNYRNPVVHKIVNIRDEKLLRLSIQMLYVQAVLLSHRPLTASELTVLNQGLLSFIDWGADAVEGWIQ